MSATVVFLQQELGKLNSASLSAISAAQEICKKSASTTLIGLCLGNQSQAAATQAASHGLNSIFWSEQPEFSKNLALVYAEALADFARQKNAGFIVAASTSFAKEILPAAAAHLNAAMASEVLAIGNGGTFIRPMYAGNVLAEVSLHSDLKIISVRATSFSAAPAISDPSVIEQTAFSISKSANSEIISFDSSATGRPELADAKIIVSGGRGVQSKEGFEKYINPLADTLGAAIGASRAAVDAGYAPNDWQVGQTGKTVAPQLYIAVGISGAIQHLAGMKDSKVVVAINKDPEAPIFEVADYGLVADLEQAVPQLIEMLKTAK